MRKAWCIEYTEVLYQLLLHGNVRCDVFVVEPDRIVFLDAVGVVLERFDLDQS